MADMHPDVKATIERMCEQFAKRQLSGFAQEMEQYAKENAPWEDHTHDARNGLRGNVFYRPGVDMGIILSHTVEYGQYLETANDGRYAILKPTVEKFMPDIKTALMQAFGGKG
jgi:hypothetical protein